VFVGRQQGYAAPYWFGGENPKSNTWICKTEEEITMAGLFGGGSAKAAENPKRIRQPVESDKHIMAAANAKAKEMGARRGRQSTILTGSSGNKLGGGGGGTDN
jgi:hypothetical protein